MRALAKHSPDKLVDLLGERLTFERASVELYDAIVFAIETCNDARVQRTLPAMRDYRDQEHAHAEWLAAQIRALGGETEEPTERARIAAIESSGIEQIVLDGDDDPAHLFHALLVAELADKAGWDLLVLLAHDAGDRDAKRAFKRFLREEEEHLLFVRRAVEHFALTDVLGAELRLPASP
jgi:bacterioferritin (cytochrome b1)